MSDPIKKLAKKTKLSERDVVSILAEQHLIYNHYKDLTEVQVNLEANTAKLLEKLCKILKVQPGAIVSIAAKNYLAQQKASSSK